MGGSTPLQTGGSANYALTVVILLKFYISKILVVILEHSQTGTTYLFQNDVGFHFEPYWKQENVANINFLVLH